MPVLLQCNTHYSPDHAFPHAKLTGRPKLGNYLCPTATCSQEEKASASHRAGGEHDPSKLHTVTHYSEGHGIRTAGVHLSSQRQGQNFLHREIPASLQDVTNAVEQFSPALPPTKLWELNCTECRHNAFHKLEE